jgi:hypothetical protein
VSRGFELAVAADHAVEILAGLEDARFSAKAYAGTADSPIPLELEVR